MTAIRCVLISFLVLWLGNARAQGDFEWEKEYNLDGEKAYGLQQRSTAYTNRYSNPYLLERPNPTADTLGIKFKRIEVTDFRFYFDESFFDSVFDYYNSSDFEQLNYRHPDSLETQYHSNQQTYYKLFRKVYGVIQTYTPIKREILSFRDSVFRIALLTCKASFKGIDGRMNISLDVTKKEKPLFAGMKFTPYDYSEIPFFANISGLSLEYIKTKNITALKKEASQSFLKRVANEKKLEKNFAALNCDSIKQFTSSLSQTDGNAIARVIYDLPKEDKYLALIYVNEDKKFKLYDLGFIDKKKK